jgi:hypothetical protein
MKRYPKGSLFQLMGGLYGIDQSNLVYAVQCLQAGMDNCKSISSVPPVLMRVLSNCYSMQFDWKTTTAVLEKIVYTEFGAKGMCSFCHI